MFVIINVGCMGEEGKEEEEELGVTCLGVLGEWRLTDFTRQNLRIEVGDRRERAVFASCGGFERGEERERLWRL